MLSDFLTVIEGAWGWSHSQPRNSSRGLNVAGGADDFVDVGQLANVLWIAAGM